MSLIDAMESQPQNGTDEPSSTSTVETETERGPSSSVSLLTAAMGPEKNGWLTKQGGVVKSWKKRFFVLANNTLRYYKNEEDTKPKGEIPLEGCSVEFVPTHKYDRQYCFEVHTATEKKRVYILQADSGVDMHDWLDKIRKAMLRIRSEKSRLQREQYQEERQRAVTELLAKQEEEATRRLTDSSDHLPLPSEQQGDATDSRDPQAEPVTAHGDPSGTAPTDSITGGPSATLGVKETQRDGPARSAPPPTSPLAAKRVSFTTRPDHSSSMALPGDGAEEDNEERYRIYLEWLNETSTHQRRGTTADQFRARPRTHSDEMNESLLSGGRIQSKKNPIEECCAKCIVL